MSTPNTELDRRRAELNRVIAQERKRAAEELHMRRQGMATPWSTIILALALALAAGAGLMAIFQQVFPA